MSVPALKELRRIFADARITLHTRTWAEGLFSDVPFIDELVTFDKSRWAAKDVYENAQFLKEDGYDLAVLFPNSFESAATSFLSSIPRRVGYNKDLRGLLLTDPIAVPEWKDRRHEVFYYLNLISEIERRVLGRDTVSEALPDTSLTISDERKIASRELLASHGVDASRTLVTMGAGSTNSMAKRWPSERFVEIARYLVSEHGASVVLLGAPDEAAVADEIASASGPNVLNLAGKTKLAEAVAILSLADLMISNDMGLAHIAPAVGAPTVVIFGPTNPTTTRPWGHNVQVLQRDVACADCARGDKSERHKCTRWPSVEEVKDARILGLADERSPITELTEVM